MKKTTLLVLIVILSVLGAGFYIYTLAEEGGEALFSSQQEEERSAQEEVVGEMPMGVVASTPDGAQRYTSESFGFSFIIPSEFSVGEFNDGGGRVVLIQSGEGRDAFQVFITHWDEPEQSITVERIREDLPDMEIHNALSLSMDGGTRSGLSFVSEDPSFGQTREVWFIYNDHLYQVITYVEAQEFLASVLGTWEFVN